MIRNTRRVALKIRERENRYRVTTTLGQPTASDAKVDCYRNPAMSVLVPDAEPADVVNGITSTAEKSHENQVKEEESQQRLDDADVRLCIAYP
jgi:hypothetical protein